MSTLQQINAMRLQLEDFLYSGRISSFGYSTAMRELDTLSCESQRDGCEFDCNACYPPLCEEDL